MKVIQLPLAKKEAGAGSQHPPHMIHIGPRTTIFWSQGSGPFLVVEVFEEPLHDKNNSALVVSALRKAAVNSLKRASISVMSLGSSSVNSLYSVFYELCKVKPTCC